MHLQEELYQSLYELADQGNIALDQGRYEEAIVLWQQALDVLPAPVNQWQAAFWLYASMGEALYQLERYDEATAVLEQAAHNPEGKENPYPYYMLGKCAWRSGQDKAAKYLLKAYDLDGEGIFIADPVDGEACLAYLYDLGAL
ncbi:MULTISPECIES: tetratricopeptide repeat protein [Paenalcaligenes]|uniref:Tetratricopeptide repeat protein n=1 Tax=Paenalcaligenes hermetiae TaxID=1157987 RepID=A0ABP9MBP2_9BURK|nr:tetratricopeptide repeat protein [Paenalcaligenes sp.]